MNNNPDWLKNAVTKKEMMVKERPKTILGKIKSSKVGTVLGKVKNSEASKRTGNVLEKMKSSKAVTAVGNITKKAGGFIQRTIMKL